ncbi:MAG: flagellar protein FlgN [Zoogloeaceae bacterium]|jgi:flagellar biosynthesis/type III secretory pathway chaperone|nr:flagellar protein FlgN [Zoogloeaceae bacterium]
MNTATNFAQLLATEITAVEQFVALLQEEQRQLQENEIDALENTTASKLQFAEELKEIGKARHACLSQLGLARQDDNGQSVEDWLIAQGNPQLLQAWHTLQNLARDAKSLNEINGQCIALLSRNTREQLDALTGRQSNGIFYKPDGQAAASGNFRISDSV